MFDKSLIEVSLEIEKEFVEPVSYLFKKHCDYDYIIEEKLEYSPDENEKKPEAKKVIIKSYIIDDAAKKSKIAYVDGGLSLIRLVAEIPELVIKKILEKEWTDQKFPSINIGKNFLITSDLTKLENKDSRIIINLNPGLGFGTGHHPTTKMMLEKIEEINFYKKTVLDFGCGSGILSIATQKMKASKVWSIDTDEFAIISSKENLKRSNLNVENLIEGSIENLDNKLKFDVILANISSNIIMKYSNEMKRKLNQNGILIASGILSKNIEETLEKLQKAGFKLLSQTVEEEWECLVLK
ncbi:MAG: 50S ribosomal protein L11 methyltransferase [Dehalococcoidia bacterium]